MPIADLAPSGTSSPDGLAYDVKSKVDELVDAVNDLNDSLTTESAATLTSAVGDLDTSVGTLQEEVETAETGLLDRATALETTVDTATTGLTDRVAALEGNDVITAQADVTDAGVTASDLYTKAELQAVNDQLDALLAALRAAGVLIVTP